MPFEAENAQPSSTHDIDLSALQNRLEQAADQLRFIGVSLNHMIDGDAFDGGAVHGMRNIIDRQSADISEIADLLDKHITNGAHLARKSERAETSQD